MIRFTARGEPVSLKNNKQLGSVKESSKGNRYREIVNSREVINYQKFFLPQIPWQAQAMLDVPVRVLIKIWYRTQRPDLDEAIILDLMQAQYTRHPKTQEKLVVRRGVYTNDRLVRERHVYHGIDKQHPRVEIIVMPIERLPESDMSLLETHVRAMSEAQNQLMHEIAQLQIGDPAKEINYARTGELF